MTAALASRAKAKQPLRAAPAPVRPQRSAAKEFVPPIASLSAVPARPAVQRKCDGCESEDKEQKLPVQTRLKVGPVGDPYEREADAIAGQVMAMRDVDVSPAAPTVQRACSADEPIRARHARANAGTEMIEASDSELTGGGSPLPASTRGFFEERMGRDLSDVRVHEGNRAGDLNGSIAARAFTYRNHVWLGAGEHPTPNFTMAHELAHVMQQTAPGPVGAIRPRRLTRSRASPGTARVQRIAPLVLACIIGAVIGVVLDVITQLAPQIRDKKPIGKMKLDVCSLVISAIVGCVGSIVSAKFLEPWLKAKFPRLAAKTGTVIGGLLIKAAAATGMIVPKKVVKVLLMLGCITQDEAEELGLNRREGMMERLGIPISDDYIPLFPPKRMGR